MQASVSVRAWVTQGFFKKNMEFRNYIVCNWNGSLHGEPYYWNGYYWSGMRSRAKVYTETSLPSEISGHQLVKKGCGDPCSWIYSCKDVTFVILHAETRLLRVSLKGLGDGN